MWWERRRFAYNIALVAAGVVGFVLFVTAMSTCPLDPEMDHEITILGTAVQACAYLFAMSIANLFYFLGYLVDVMSPARYLERARRIAFWSGLSLSVALPTAPFLAVIVMCSMEVR